VEPVPYKAMVKMLCRGKRWKTTIYRGYPRQVNIPFYPIIYLYLHTVELYLKRSIPVAANLVEQHLREDEKRLLLEKGTHRLDQLWAMCKPRLILMRKNGQCEITEDELAGIESYIKQLTDVDEQFFIFRFAESKDGKPNLSGFRHINIMRSLHCKSRSLPGLRVWTT